MSSRERNIKLTVEYDGSAHAGWQIQREPVRTVQGELVRAIESMARHPVELVGASRTDRGVHALGQVASFRTVSAIPVAGFCRGLNSSLPRDIAVTRVEEVPLEFHARHDAAGKHYRYTVCRSPVNGVFTRRWSFQVTGELDLGAMREAAGHLVGCFDFGAFASRSKDPPENTVRTVHAVSLAESAPFLFIDVVGRSFLYTMVRTVAGTLLEVGRGKRTPASVHDARQSLDRRRAGPTAAAHGLCLVEVFYIPAALEAVVERFQLSGSERGVSTGRDPAAGTFPRLRGD